MATTSNEMSRRATGKADTRPLPALLTVAIAASIAAAPLSASIAPTTAYASGVSEAKARYDEANGTFESIQKSADDTQRRLDDLNAKLPESRERAADAIREMYKAGIATGSGKLALVSHIVGAKSISEAASLVQYNTKMVDSMTDRKSVV